MRLLCFCHNLLVIIHIYSEEFFKEAGQVVDVRFGRTNDGDDRFLGFGVVEFATAGEALKVIVFFFCFCL